MLLAPVEFCLSLHYNSDESYFYVNQTEIYKFKAKDYISWYKFCLGSASQDFTKDEQMKFDNLCFVRFFSLP